MELEYAYKRLDKFGLGILCLSFGVRFVGFYFITINYKIGHLILLVKILRVLHLPTIKRYLMRFSYIIIAVFLITACQEVERTDADIADLPLNEHKGEEEKVKVSLPEIKEASSYSDPVAEIYEVDPMEYPLQGTIDGDTIYMSLDFQAHKIEGKYMYKKYKKPISLEGYYTLQGFVLNEFNKEGSVSAYFMAEGNYHAFSGKWYKTDVLHDASVKLALLDSYGVYLEPTAQFTALGQDGPSEYAIEDGLASNCEDCISFRSMEKPNQYLRHQSFQIKQHAYNDCKNNLFRKDASFRMLTGLASDTAVSFQSYNYPNHFIFYNTASNRFAMMDKSKMTPEQKVKASFILDKEIIDTGGLDFELVTQKDQGLENSPFVAGRIRKEAYKLIDAYVGDGATYYFEDQNGEHLYFERNFAEDFELVVNVPEGEANMDNQGWMINPLYEGVWFEVTYSEMFTYTDFNASEYYDILAIRSLKKL